MHTGILLRRSLSLSAQVRRQGGGAACSAAPRPGAAGSLAPGAQPPAASHQRRLGSRRDRMPLSARGPGTLGSIVSLVDRRLPDEVLAAIARVADGRLGLFSRPLAVSWAASYTKGQLEEWKDLAHGDTPCPMCEAEPHRAADPFHVLTCCTHPAVAMERERALRSLPDMLPDLARQLRMAGRGGARRTDAAEAAGAAEAVRAAMAATPWTSPDGRHALYLLICATPWPADAAGRRGLPAAGLSAVLGRTFDTTIAPPYRLRDAAYRWAKWAGTAALAMGTTWSRAADGSGAAPRSGPSHLRVA